jgi:hypothetical protein
VAAMESTSLERDWPEQKRTTMSLPDGVPARTWGLTGVRGRVYRSIWFEQVFE